MNTQTSIIFLYASNEQSNLIFLKNTIHNSMKIYEILRNQSDKRLLGLYTRNCITEKNLRGLSFSLLKSSEIDPHTYINN